MLDMTRTPGGGVRDDGVRDDSQMSIDGTPPPPGAGSSPLPSSLPRVTPPPAQYSAPSVQTDTCHLLLDLHRCGVVSDAPEPQRHQPQPAAGKLLKFSCSLLKCYC